MKLGILAWTTMEERMLSALVLAAAIASPDAQFFERIPYTPGSSVYATIKTHDSYSQLTTVQIRTGSEDGKTYWLALGGIEFSKKQSFMWTDSRRCPNLTVVVGRLQNLPTIMVTPFDETPFVPPLHAKAYEVSVQGEFRTDGFPGRMRLIAYGDQPLGGWVEEALASLKPCWTEGRHPRHP